MASTSNAGGFLVMVLVAAIAGFALRAWLVMLALGTVNVNASWGQSLLATLALSFAFAKPDLSVGE
jgi:hypothetical protein